MASFKICIRGRRNDGLFPVFIRIIHNRKVGYIKTDKCVDYKSIKKGEIVDPIVLAYCSKEILRYNEALNAVNLSSLTVSEVIWRIRTKLPPLKGVSLRRDAGGHFAAEFPLFTKNLSSVIAVPY